MERLSRREAFKAITVFVGSALGLGGVAACKMPDTTKALEYQNAILERIGINEDHPVIVLRSVPGFSQRGDVAGSFLAFEGRFEGKATQMLQFAWKVNKEDKTIQISQVPLERVQFKIADPETQPTVRFDLDTQKLLIPGRRVADGFMGLGQKYGYKDTGYEMTESRNLNDYVVVSRLVVISLSEKDYDELRNPRK